ncbi:MAG: YfhO family protein [Clostridiales bacterium]|nr:YfhO family protein [Clostridiales bacterium]
MKERTRYQEANLALLLMAGLLAIWAVGSYATRSTTIGMVYGCVNLTVWPMLSWLLGREMRCVERDKDALSRTIWGLLGLYVVQKLLIFWIKIIIGKSASLNLLNDDNTAWLYLCGAAWLALALLIERRGWKHGPVLAVSVALGCVAGYLPVVENLLCLNKLFVFAPLFLVGFWGLPDRLEGFLNRNWVRVLSLVALLAVAGGCLVASRPLYNNEGFLTAANAYASLSNTWLNTFGGLFRLAWYGVVAVVGAALLSVMPRKKLPLLTLCGKRWFSVYFWLRPVTYFLFARIVKVLISCGRLGKIDAVLICLVVLPLLGLHSLETATKGIFHWYGWWRSYPERLGPRRRSSWRAFLVPYTVLFFIVLSGTLSALFSQGYTMVWTPDGESLYLNIMYYTRNYILEFFSNLLHGQFALPQWDFSIGYGYNTLSVLHFNPLFLIALLLPEAWMEFVYTFYAVAQLYLAGVAFAALMREIGKGEPLAVTCGALVYVFSGFSLQVMAKHIYFITFMLLMLPVILWAAERWLHRRKWGAFVLAIFFCILGGYYFTYINSLLMALYLLIREIYVNGKQVKKTVSELLHLIGYYLIGLGLSMAFLLPTVMNFLTCGRVGDSGSETFASLFYDADYYQELVYTFISPGSSASYSTSLGFAAIVLVALVVLFLKRKRKDLAPLRWAVALGVLFLLFPTVGSIFNGFGYVTNRWSYGLALVMAFVVAWLVPELKDLTLRQWKVVAVCAALYVLLSCGCAYAASASETRLEILRRGYIVLAVTVAVLLLARRLLARNPHLGQSVVCGVTVLSVLVSGSTFFEFSSDAKSNVSIGELYNRYAGSAEVAAAAIEDDGFYRIDIEQNRTNRFTLTDGYGTSFYWSVTDADLVQFFQELCLNTVNQNSGILGTSSCLAVDALTSVKYGVFKSSKGDSGYIPYGFEEVGTKGKYTIYENQYALPIGYAYTSYMTKSDYLALTPVERQQALLQCVVLEDEDAAALNLDWESTTPVDNAVSIPWTITEADGVTDNGDGTYSAEKDGTMTLTFEGLPDSETLLYLDNLGIKRESSRAATKVYVSGNGVNKASYVRGKGNTYYIETEGRVYNLGYSEEGVTTCTIRFNTKQTYTIDEIQVLCIPVEDYVEQVTALGETVLENVTEGTDTVTGDITMASDGVLVLSIPYVDGWTAYVDGEETELIQANTGFSGIALSAGTHSIRLKYVAPGQNAGTAITAVTLLGLAVYFLLHHRRRRQKDTPAKQKP